jgi:hypothetical protein
MVTNLRESLIRAGRLLIDQERAEVLVEPRAREEGFWFGGGNMCRSAAGDLWLVGRYRNGGDSRVGIDAGPRGAELVLLRSTDEGRSFTEEISFLKDDLAPEGEEVLSIEGASLQARPGGVHLYVSSEKNRTYPDNVSGFQKPGTGVWSIDVLSAPDMPSLGEAPIRPALESDEPAYLHIKDPVVFEMDGRPTMIYCSHPFSWTSSNTGYAVNDGVEWEDCARSILGRGPAWDVAIWRVTGRLALPRTGNLSGRPPISLYFYDGGECIHDHGGNRPRGYSCEEIGGLAAGCDEEFPRLERLSQIGPLFVSPHGTGCSRYVSVFETEERYLATWQQSQPDGSQPLVINRVAKGDLRAKLG